jgi:hypothetical protein
MSGNTLNLQQQNGNAALINVDLHWQAQRARHNRALVAML